MNKEQLEALTKIIINLVKQGESIEMISETLRENFAAQFQDMPHGAIYEANRYDTDNEHVIHLWIKEQNTKMFGEKSFDIKIPKERLK